MDLGAFRGWENEKRSCYSVFLLLSDNGCGHPLILSGLLLFLQFILLKAIDACMLPFLIFLFCFVCLKICICHYWKWKAVVLTLGCFSPLSIVASESSFGYWNTWYFHSSEYCFVNRIESGDLIWTTWKVCITNTSVVISVFFFQQVQGSIQKCSSASDLPIRES